MVGAAGVDTWSVCWYLEDDSPAWRAVEKLATEPAPRSKLIPHFIGGHRVGCFPGSRLLFAEGHPDPDGLASTEQLPIAFRRIVEGLNDYGVKVPLTQSVGRRDSRKGKWGVGFGGVRRLDATVDLRFSDPLEGQAVLCGVAALPIPRMKTGIVREAGGRRVETVYFRGYAGKRVLGRWYDKGVESREASRGVWVRPEDQRRFDAGSRLSLEQVASPGLVRQAFVRRFEPLWQASKGVKVGGAIKLAQRLGELQDAGVITPGEAKRIAGHLLLQTADAHRQKPSTIRGDRAAARRLGLVLADGVLDEVEIDLGEVCEAALDSDHWGAQG